MKYRLIIALLMFMLVGSTGNAQSFRDNNNMLLGKVESDGTVRNALVRSTMMEPSGIITIVELALSRRMVQLETIITYDWVLLVQMVSFAITTICVLVLSALMAPYETITI